jgi:lipopolysaccharide export system ATP-binding protein
MNPKTAKRLHAHDLNKNYGKRHILRGVSLHVQRGEVVGLLGPNGAGKTTTFHMVTGLLKNPSRSVFLDYQDISSASLLERSKKGIVYLPQEPSVFPNLTVFENLLAVLEFQPLNRQERFSRAEHSLDELQIGRLSGQKAYSLSGGERRRLEIARALCIEPLFLLMDEPFTGIDPITIQDLQGIIRRLKAKDIGILITDHNVRETLAICDRAYILYDGKILEEGTDKQILASEQARRLYLGEDFAL